LKNIEMRQFTAEKETSSKVREIKNRQREKIQELQKQYEEMLKERLALQETENLNKLVPYKQEISTLQ